MKKTFRSPPRVAQVILKLVFSDRGRFTHLGDFTQVYNHLIEEKGPLRAWVWYWTQTLNAMPWFLSINFYWSVAMIKNFLVTAVRYMFKRKGFSLINIVGLAFGIAIIVLIGQFLYFEFSYDHFHPKIDRIYQLVDTGENSYRIDYRVRDRILENIPQVENACLYSVFPVEANVADRVFEFQHMLYVDPSFFEVFHFPFVYGDAQDSLASLDSVILTESVARRIYGSENPIGKPILLEHEEKMFVSGVVKDFPLNSSFRADLFTSSANTKAKRLKYSIYCLHYDGKDDSQCRYPYGIFLELSQNSDIPEVEEQICGLFTGEDFRFPNTLALTPFKESYLHNRFSGSMLSHGNLGLLKILAGIGLLVLILAVVNYINLSTAAYKYRIKEIGVKKCLGVHRRSLIFQFLGESLIVCFIAAMLGLILAHAFLPFFNQFVEKPQQIQIFTNPQMFVLFIIFLLFLGAASGVYPAFVLSGIVPMQLLRTGGGGGAGRSGTILRNVLNVFQFSVAICLLIGLTVMVKQIRYVKHKDLGFDTERLVTLRLHHKMDGMTTALLDKLRQYPGISKMCLSNGVPGKINITLGNFRAIIVDEHFLDTYGLNVVDGRSLLPGDIGKACLVNRSGLEKFESGDFRGNEVNDVEVVGVVSDFHFSSFHQDIGPLALMHYGTNWGSSHISFRLSGSVQEGLEYIRSTWMEVSPDFPYEYHFVDEWFDALYRKEENLAKMIAIFAVLAIVISCLGLFGLALFSAQQRTKEIGIRKVLGSSVREIVMLLTRSSLKWALLSNFIAWPASWFVMSKWLANFAYRTGISWWVYAFAGGSVLIIAVLTVSWQTLRAAVADPVDVLRYE
jgi:putative ABC transport system permease protein